MKTYHRNKQISNLEVLPPLSETAGYEIVEGDPRASIRIDSGTANGKHRLGIWMCTPGTFTCTEKGDELQTVLEGQLTLIEEDGSEHQFGPGDSVYTQKGSRVTWKISETVKKVFFTHDPDGDSG